MKSSNRRKDAKLTAPLVSLSDLVSTNYANKYDWKYIAIVTDNDWQKFFCFIWLMVNFFIILLIGSRLSTDVLNLFLR